MFDFNYRSFQNYRNIKHGFVATKHSAGWDAGTQQRGAALAFAGPFSPFQRSERRAEWRRNGGPPEAPQYHIAVTFEVERRRLINGPMIARSAILSRMVSAYLRLSYVEVPYFWVWVHYNTCVIMYIYIHKYVYIHIYMRYYEPFLLRAWTLVYILLLYILYWYLFIIYIYTLVWIYIYSTIYIYVW